MHVTVCTCTLGRLRYVRDFIADLRQRPLGLVACPWRLGGALRFIPVALNWAPIVSSRRPGG
jgi:hypothetical protein